MLCWEFFFLNFKDCEINFLRKEKSYGLKDNIVIWRINTLHKFYCAVLEEETKFQTYFKIKYDIVGDSWTSGAYSFLYKHL